MAEEYQESEMSKIVKKLMDEEGFEFGEAVKEAMRRTRKDVAGGGNINYTGNMMRSNYAMGSEDQASGIKSLEESKMMASAPDPMAEKNDMSLDLFGKPLELLDEEEMEYLEMQIEDRYGKRDAPSIKMAGGTDPMLLREYEQYVFEMQEMGREPMDLKSFIRQMLAEARMGVKDGGRMNYAQGTPKLMGNPAVVTEIKNMRENQIMNPDVEDVADYKTYYKKLKAQDEEIKRMLDKVKKEKQKRAKGGIAGVL